jgi:hypothetical protein
MRTTTMISVVHALPSPNGDCPQFESLVTGTGNRSCSVGEKAHTFDGALLAGVHCPMQARRRALCHRGASCGTFAPRAFLPSAAARHVDVNIAQSCHCRGASLHSPPSFSSSHYFASVFWARHPPCSAPVPPMQGKVAVQGQVRDAHRNVLMLEVVAAAMKKWRQCHHARGGVIHPQVRQQGTMQAGFDRAPCDASPTRTTRG